MNNSCFVIMPIGTQTIGDQVFSEEQLREKYDYIIKNAINRADPTIEVIRADEEFNPGSISNDIFTKLMYSKYVIADITYPNPNVFYELGIRHAISSRTILIREKVNHSIPFDISHLRFVEYTQDPEGMTKLSDQLKRRFNFYENNPDKPDNQFLELCTFINFSPEVYKQQSAEKEGNIANLFSLFFKNPKLLKSITDQSLADDERNALLFEALSENPSQSEELILTLLKSGLIQM